jgi:hypothetical protein
MLNAANLELHSPLWRFAGQPDGAQRSHVRDIFSIGNAAAPEAAVGPSLIHRDLSALPKLLAQSVDEVVR